MIHFALAASERPLAQPYLALRLRLGCRRVQRSLERDDVLTLLLSTVKKVKILSRLSLCIYYYVRQTHVLSMSQCHLRTL